MLVESMVVSVVTSGLTIASIQNAADNHCENCVSTHWHQHHPHSFPKKKKRERKKRKKRKKRKFICENQPKVSRWYLFSGLECDLQCRGFIMWLTVKTFPVGDHWCVNLKVLWIRSKIQWLKTDELNSVQDSNHHFLTFLDKYLLRAHILPHIQSKSPDLYKCGEKSRSPRVLF